MEDKFYRKFEDRYRGSRELIKDRLRVYLPFVKPLQTICPQSTAFDLGCGRGEWLELLTEEGFKAKGVDLDPGMLAACKALGLNVEVEDAIVALNTLPDESVSIVSAFHVIEHIDFDNLMALVKQAFRVLVPGGVLIFETPNAENIIVGVLNFYLDPSHLKPIPPELLTFIIEMCGFERFKVLRLQESSWLHDKDFDVRLIDVIGGVSPDYSVVAQKFFDNPIKSMFDEVFAKEYGLTLNALAERYEASMQKRVQQTVAQSNQNRQEITDVLHQLKCVQQQANVHMDAVRSEVHVLSQTLDERHARINQLSDELTESEAVIASLTQNIGECNHRIEEISNEMSKQKARMESLAQDVRTRTVENEQLMQKATELIEQVKISKQSADHWRLVYDKLQMEVGPLRDTLDAIYESRSWRITAPMRYLKTVFICRFWFSIKAMLKMALIKLAVYINRRPVLRRMILRIICRAPKIRYWLIRIVAQQPVPAKRNNISFNESENRKTVIDKNTGDARSFHGDGMHCDTKHMTVRARRIYKSLQTEFMRNNQEEH